MANFGDLSVFAPNLVTGLGLGLAIDYSLFMVSRYREEAAVSGFGLDAIRRTLETSGRTILFSCTCCLPELARTISTETPPSRDGVAELAARLGDSDEHVCQPDHPTPASREGDRPRELCLRLARLPLLAAGTQLRARRSRAARDRSR